MPYSDPIKQKQAQHKSYLKNIEKVKIRRKQAKDKWKEKVREAKDKACMDCQIKYPYYVMEFDHREGALKVASINYLVAHGNWKSIWEEIKKCDVVCSNCHAIRTWNRIFARVV